MDEFTPIQTLFPQASEKCKISFVLTSSTDGFKLVYDVDNGEKYVATDLHTQKSFNGSYLFEYGKETKLYIWNPSKTSGKVTIEHVTSQKVVEYPLLRQR
jgi:hypothetical protein